MIDRRLAIWYSLIAMWLLLMVSVLCHAEESPTELLNSTSNMSLPEEAFLLATHGFNVTYLNGVFYLNGSEIRQCRNTLMWEETRPKGL